jgi:hypothetical protein
MEPTGRKSASADKATAHAAGAEAAAHPTPETAAHRSFCRHRRDQGGSS